MYALNYSTDKPWSLNFGVYAKGEANVLSLQP